MGIKLVLQLLLIAAGGATGALLRFWMSNGVSGVLGRGFPYGTMAVNIIGSFVMGFLFTWMMARGNMSPEGRSALTVGLLGAFTTFSTFSIETMNLVESGELSRAGINILLSVLLCLLGCWLGMMLGRQV